ncbi:hypothetical protein [Tardiphaga sp. 862_B3_N1_1]|uniref:hypothetical protein n=1 Tax=Tardiphaga sp. 862_B3_N1_1 TaxID=3240763 RepID=UPI003F8B1A79
MFKFNLPKWAFLDVTLPTGAVSRLLHIGDGEFVSELPPVMVEGLVPTSVEIDAAAVHTVQPVQWDSTIIPWRSQVQGLRWVYDAPAAMQALLAAEAKGDQAAITLLQRLKQAESGVMQEPATPQ